MRNVFCWKNSVILQQFANCTFYIKLEYKQTIQEIRGFSKLPVQLMKFLCMNLKYESRVQCIRTKLRVPSFSKKKINPCNSLWLIMRQFLRELIQKWKLCITSLRTRPRPTQQLLNGYHTGRIWRNRVLWPPRSPDLKQCDYYLRRTLIFDIWNSHFRCKTRKMAFEVKLLVFKDMRSVMCQ